MTILVPRQYQAEAVHSILAYFQRKAGNPVIAMPTGTGKALVIAMFLQLLFHRWPRQRVMMLTHVKELLSQNEAELKNLWPTAPCGMYSSGLNKKQHNRPITFAGIASVAKRPDLFGHIDLVIIDEAHLVSPTDETMYRGFIGALQTVNPDLKVIGLTATPWRLGQGHITEDGLFTDVCFDITGMDAFNRLIAEGYLAPVIPRQTRNVLDVDGVHKRGGEFVAGELQAAVDKLEITHAALTEALELAADRKHWLVFATGVEHAIHITEMLLDMGVSAVAVHSKLTGAQRDEAIEGFKRGKYRAIVNNNVLTTGFNFKPIDCIIMLRPTSSPVLWIQMLGRGTRPSPETGKKNCLVLDFAGNTRRLGPINDPVIPRKNGKGGGEAPVKLCEVCETFNHASARHCINCGAEFVFRVKIEAHAAGDELLRGNAPITAVFDVDHITYSVHNKVGRPSTMKVTYYCGLRSFSEYVCVEHEGFAQRKARKWWAERTSNVPFPETVEDALGLTGVVTPATNLRVWVNKEYPEILAHCFDGTSFGTVADLPPPPTVSVQAAARAGATVSIEDDDIPF